MRKFTMALSTSSLICIALFLQGCGVFVTHYDAGAYQYFTSLKAFHIKFLEDNTVTNGTNFDEAKAKATCDAGELKFREATEYANGKHDDTRVNAIGYLHNVFVRNCKLTLEGKKLFGADYSAQQKEDLIKNYDWAIAGESERVNAKSK